MNDDCKSSCCFCNEDALSFLCFDLASDKKYVSKWNDMLGYYKM